MLCSGSKSFSILMVCKDFFQRSKSFLGKVLCFTWATALLCMFLNQAWHQSLCHTQRCPRTHLWSIHLLWLWVCVGGHLKKTRKTGTHAGGDPLLDTHIILSTVFITCVSGNVGCEPQATQVSSEIFQISHFLCFPGLLCTAKTGVVHLLIWGICWLCGYVYTQEHAALVSAEWSEAASEEVGKKPSFIQNWCNLYSSAHCCH